MKKKTLPLFLALVAFGLTACGEASSTTPTSQDTTPTQTTDTTKDTTASETTSSSTEGWDDATKKLFKDHLHNIELPYFQLNNQTVNFLEGRELIVFEATDLEEGDLEEISNLFVEDGWDGGDVSQNMGMEEDGYLYSYMISTSTDEGNRFVEVDFYCYETLVDEEDPSVTSEAYAKSGNFRLTAYDPYTYEFPAEEADWLASIVSTNFFEHTPVPSYDGAEYYKVIQNLSAIGAYKPGLNSDDGGYTTVLEETGFSVSFSDQFGAYVGTPEDKDYQILYRYDLTSGMFMMMFFEYEEPLVPYNAWNEEQIAKLFEDYGIENFSYTIPALNVEGATYYYTGEYASSTGYILVQGVTEKDYTSYQATLKTAGWEISEDEFDENAVQFSKKIDNRLPVNTLSYSEANSSITITLQLNPDVAPYDTFPKDIIQENLVSMYGDGFTYQIPAYSGQGVKQYKVNGNCFTFILEDGADLDTVLATYMKDLVAAGFVQKDETTAVTADEIYRIQADIDYILGTIEFMVDLAPEPIPVFDTFPKDKLISDFKTHNPDFNDTIIALDGGDEYSYIINVYETDVFGSIDCLFTKGDMNKIVADYEKALKDAGFTDYDPEEPGNGEYRSPKGQYKLRVEADDDYTGYFVISLNFDDIVDGTL